MSTLSSIADFVTRSGINKLEKQKLISLDTNQGINQFLNKK